jgi:hypothetical protein
LVSLVSVARVAWSTTVSHNVARRCRTALEYGGILRRVMGSGPDRWRSERQHRVMPLWDRVGESTYGPPPGFLSGGPNPYYECGDTNDPACSPALVSPPLDQPPQKSYKDFNAVWPEGSWSISEPSDGYQVAYIRLLAKFVR